MSTITYLLRELTKFLDFDRGVLDYVNIRISMITIFSHSRKTTRGVLLFFLLTISLLQLAGALTSKYTSKYGLRMIKSANMICKLAVSLKKLTSRVTCIFLSFLRTIVLVYLVWLSAYCLQYFSFFSYLLCLFFF